MNYLMNFKKLPTNNDLGFWCSLIIGTVMFSTGNIIFGWIWFGITVGYLIACGRENK